jgi:hypothetical protein
MIITVQSPRGTFLQGTLTLMQRNIDQWSIHPFMVQLARAICAKDETKTPKSETEAIHRFVRQTVSYRGDPVGAEWVQDPFETLVKSRAGDCDDMAVACGALLQAIGHPCKATAVKWSGRADFSHAVCKDRLTGQVVDAVAENLMPWPPPGKQVQVMMEAN